MRCLRCLPLLLLGFLLASDPASAQQGTATLSGTVTDAETGDPLEGVHVFIAVSMNGTTTNAEGRFQLDRIPLGAHRIYVTMLGYGSVAQDTLFREARVYDFDVRLTPEAIEIGGITVEAERDRTWQRRYEKFVRLFIGETPNAEQTEITNPEYLDFESKVGRFTARASEPLIIENRALGYRIQYFLKEFVALPNRTMYDGEPLYEEMDPASPEQAAAWDANRRKAFYGSFRHFMLAVLAGQTEEHGFKTYSRPATQGSPGGASPFQQNALAGNQRFPLDPSEIVEDGEVPTEHRLDFNGFVEVVYTNELEDEKYLEWQQTPRRQPKYQTSMIQLERGPTVVDYKGDVLDPYGVTFYSYWAFERVADELPKEYRPQ